MVTSEETKKHRIDQITTIQDKQDMMDASRPTIFFSPNSREGFKVFDYEDLLEEKLAVLCYVSPSSHKIIYVWTN